MGDKPTLTSVAGVRVTLDALVDQLQEKHDVLTRELATVTNELREAQALQKAWSRTRRRRTKSLPPRVQNAPARILAYVAAHEPCPYAAIAAALGVRRSMWLSNQLARLRKAGQLRVTGRGRAVRWHLQKETVDAHPVGPRALARVV